MSRSALASVASAQPDPAVYGFSEGWASGGGEIERTFCGRSLDPATDLALIHEASGLRVPLEVRGAAGKESFVSPSIRRICRREGMYSRRRSPGAA